LVALNEELARQSAGYYAEVEQLRRDCDRNRADLDRIHHAQESLGESLESNARAIAADPLNDPANLPPPIIQLAAFVLFVAMLWDSVILVAGFTAFVERVLLHLIGFDASYAFGADFWSQWAIVVPVACYVFYYQKEYLQLAFSWIIALCEWLKFSPQTSSCLTCQTPDEKPQYKDVHNRPAQYLKHISFWKRCVLQGSLVMLASLPISWAILACDVLFLECGLPYLYAEYILNPLGFPASARVANFECYLLISFIVGVFGHTLMVFYSSPLLEHLGYDPSWDDGSEVDDEIKVSFSEPRKFVLPAVTNDARNILCRCMAEQAVDDDDEFLTDFLIIYRSRRCEDFPGTTSRVMAHCGICKSSWTEASGN
jgi:hypothetical protein